MHPVIPPAWTIHVAVAAVWLYEGLWCKLLGGEPNQLRVVEGAPMFAQRGAPSFLRALGVIEVMLAVWVLARVAPVACAAAQTVLLVSLNAAGLAFARDRIHDPAGMVLKNVVLLVLAWVSAGIPGWE